MPSGPTGEECALGGPLPLATGSNRPGPSFRKSDRSSRHPCRTSFAAFLGATGVLLAVALRAPDVRSLGAWPSGYFAILTIQWGALFGCTIVAYCLGLRRLPSSGVDVQRRFALFNGGTAVAFVLMGVFDGLVGIKADGEAGLRWDLTLLAVLASATLLASALVFLLRKGGWALRPLPFGLYLAYLYLLGALGYWALGWFLFVVPGDGETVLLWAVGPLRVTIAGNLLKGIAYVAPVAHLLGALAMAWSGRRPGGSPA